MKLVIPDELLSVLKKGSHHEAVALLMASKFETWFNDVGKPIFFRDYTKHGVEHMNGVLATCAAIIPPASCDKLTPDDVLLLVLSILHHDAALYLEEASVLKLLDPGSDDTGVPFFESTTLFEEWSMFLGKAKKWDAQTIGNVLGREFRRSGSVITDPMNRWSNLNQEDYRLIGEFIRSIHPRLAHHFALHGVPGVSTPIIQLPAEIRRDKQDLVGLIARSHGLPLRRCMDYLQAKAARLQEFDGVHAVYLMSLLRVSDFLQIQHTRVAQNIFNYRALPSRVSEIETKAHLAVKSITAQVEDPESIEITAEPEDVETFLRLVSWLTSLQNELDMSWAVLGEVYGRYPELPFHLRWRRIRSNLLDAERFARTVDYLPQRVALEVSRSELLSLLIKPLYGDDPSYGIRELVQNATDAVRERVELELRKGNDPSFKSSDGFVDITLSDVNEHTGFAQLEITDNGVGMTSDVLIKYFLTAGASYRHSEEWKTRYERLEVSSSKNSPRSAVLRSGRFGVGVLAAFLLTDEVEVETRASGSDAEGYRFRIGIEDTMVSIMRVNNLPVGSTLRMLVSRETHRRLMQDPSNMTRPRRFEWFIDEEPKVRRWQQKISEKRDLLSDTLNKSIQDWRSVRISNMPLTVSWSYSQSAVRLSVNGIFISNSELLARIDPEHCKSTDWTIETPAIKVTDPDGYLPLGLTRKELVADEYGFEAELANDIQGWYYEQILDFANKGWSPKGLHDLFEKNPFRVRRGRSRLGSQEGFSWLVTSSGIMPLARACDLGEMKLRTFLYVNAEGYRNNWYDLIRNLTSLNTLKWDAVVIALEDDSTLWRKALFSQRDYSQRWIGNVDGVKNWPNSLLGIRATSKLIQKTKPQDTDKAGLQVVTGSVPAQRAHWRFNVQPDGETKKAWSCWMREYGECPATSISQAEWQGKGGLQFAEIYTNGDGLFGQRTDLVSDWWRRYHGEGLLMWCK